MPRKYFSQRKNGSYPDLIDEIQLKILFSEYYSKFESNGYFQGSFGKDCVDKGYIPGTEGVTLKAKMVESFGKKQDELEPTHHQIKYLYQDDIFTLIEFLYDYIAKPTDIWNHEWNNCGLHVTTWNKTAGQKEWLDMWNPILTRLKEPYRLTIEGNVELVPQSEGLKKLVDEKTPHDDPENIDDKVDRACKIFLRHGSTLEDKKEALRILADVLEYLKGDIQEYLSNSDESDLFHIANRFSIRHHNESQQTQYNREIYYPWIFYAYLATIDLVARLKKAKRK